jgi:acyl-coenzyme A thioesterase PaaI-like protein
MTYRGVETGRDVTRFVRAHLYEADEGRVIGRAPAAEHLRGPHGGLRAGALFTLFDYVGGLCGGLAALPDGWVVTTNLAARIVAPRQQGPLRIEAGVLRRGRNNVVTAVQIRDEDARDALVVDGVLTSAILVPENGPPRWQRPLVLAPEDPAISVPISEWLGVRHAGPDTIEIDLAEQLRNPWGILHGGVVAMLADFATEHATGRTPTDAVLHFLAPNRMGPVRAVTRAIGDGVCRVEIRDEGSARVTAVAVVTARE